MAVISSRHLVDPELLPLLETMPQTILSDETLLELRDPDRWVMPAVEHPDRVEKSEQWVPGINAPDVKLYIYRPVDAKGALPCIYHIHGGGFVGGSAAVMQPYHHILAENFGCMVVAVEYRLAPETPFPGPMDDCYAGLSWLFAHAAEIGIDTARVGVMGESAGGGLAAGLALLVRDRKEFSLAFQHMVYPMLDDRTCVTDDPHPYAGEFVWTANNNAYGWRAYLNNEPGAPDISQYAAPARAEDLTGLPRAFISTCTLDLFLEENLEYARRLTRAGVMVDLHVYAGGFHGYISHPGADVAVRAMRDSWGALKKRLFPSGN